MKAISIMQPWATLIAEGHKRIETRNWTTYYRGPLAIHASKGLPGWLADVVRGEPQFAAALGNLFDPRGRVLGDLPRGCIVATCRLVTIQFITVDFSITNKERAFGDYTAGRYAWLLTDVQPLTTPVPARGALGLWEWEAQ